MSEKIKKVIKNHADTLIVMGMSMLFYLFFAFYDGVVICVDSPTYIDMSISREPLYPMLLAVMRKAFGEKYLFAVVIFQSVLAAWAAGSIPLFLREKGKVSQWQAIILAMVPMATSLLCRFAAQRASMYSNSILTEGIACSLFLILFRYLLEYCYDKTTKSLMISLIVCFLLVSTRKQMYFTVILLMLGIIYVNAYKFNLKRGVVLALVCIAGIVLANKGFDNVYGYVVHGTMHTHSSDNRFLATVAFYASERKNGENIQDQEAQRLFYEIYDTCDEQGYLRHSAGREWKQRVTHFGDSYDRIQIDTMWPTVEKYVSDHYTSDDVSREKMVDAFTNSIIKGLLPCVWPKLISIFIDNCCVGLVTTVAKVHPVLMVYTIFVYVIYIITLVYLGIHNSENIAFICGMMTMVSIVFNVALVSAVIFCQTRYTIYNMPLFYMTVLLMLRECYKIRKGSRRLENHG